MRPPGRPAFPLVLAVLLGGLASPAAALTDEVIFRNLRFNFAGAGARSLGMGGATVALADDAAAPQVNPAGIHLLPALTLTGDLRSFSSDRMVFTGDRGSLDVDVQTGARDLPFLGITAVSDVETEIDPSFLSVSLPLRRGTGGRRLGVALSRRLIMSQDLSLGDAGGSTEARFAFSTFPNVVSGNEIQAYSVVAPVRGSSVMSSVDWSASASLELHPDFSAGISLIYSTLDVDMSTRTALVDPLQLLLDPSHPRLPSAPGSDIMERVIDDSSSDFTFTVAVLWHPVTVFTSREAPWKLGAVYRKGSRFSVRERTFVNGMEDRVFENEVSVPDRFEVGISYQTPVSWTFSLQLERIEYSDLLDGFKAGVGVLTGEPVVGTAFAVNPGSEPEYEIEDESLARFGLEYARPARSPGSMKLALRLGYYRRPGAQVTLTKFNSSDPAVNRAYTRAFPAEDDEDHVTGGVGVSFGRSTLDLAGDFSPDTREILLSYSHTLGP